MTHFYFIIDLYMRNKAIGALYKNAPFIILDEPTAALDPISEAEIYEKFNEMGKKIENSFVERFLERVGEDEQGNDVNPEK